MIGIVLIFSKRDKKFYIVNNSYADKEWYIIPQNILVLKHDNGDKELYDYHDGKINSTVYANGDSLSYLTDGSTFSQLSNGDRKLYNSDGKIQYCEFANGITEWYDNHGKLKSRRHANGDVLWYDSDEKLQCCKFTDGSVVWFDPNDTYDDFCIFQ
jgi:hypothetical protein